MARHAVDRASRPTALLRAARHLPAVLGVVLLFGAVYAVLKEFRHLNLADVGLAIRAIPPAPLGLAFGCTVGAYGLLTLYDRLGTIYAGHRLAYGRVAVASFCACALSHNLGFAAVSGAAVRYRLYSHWGLTPIEIGKTIAFCTLTYGLGAMVLGGFILFTLPGELPWLGAHAPVWTLYLCGALLWTVVAGYVAVAALLRTVRLRGHTVELPRLPMALAQVGLAGADVATAATILWILLPPAHGLDWLLFVGIYLIAYSAGLAANLPGGVGVFDAAILFGLAPFLPAPRIIAAIAVFRLYFYVIPLFLAGALFAGNEILLRGAHAFGRVPRQGPRWTEPDFAAAAAAGAVALSGVMLLGLGLLAPRVAAPVGAEAVRQIARQAGQFVPSLIGAGLVLMALGLIRRVNLAWSGALVLLLLGTGFVLGDAERLWPAGVLLLSALVLAPFRGCFYRHARMVSGKLDRTSALSLLALAACGVALAGLRVRVLGLQPNAFWEVLLSPAISWETRASLALVVALALVAVGLLIRPGTVRARPWDVEARLRLLMFGAAIPDRADGLLYGEAERAAVAFRRLGGVLVALGDPAGAEADKISTIWRLRDLARQEGRDPVIWRAGPMLLKAYNDLGLTALPLSPGGLPVAEGSAEARASRAFLVCMAERDFPALRSLLPALGAE